MDRTRCTIEVFARAKPSKEDEAGIEVKSNIIEVADEAVRREIPFTLAFPSNCTHEQVFKGSLSGAADALTRGIDVAVFAYGLPQAGKSFTLFGTPGLSRTQPEAQGIIARVGADVFEIIQRTENSGKYFRFVCSFYQIYEEGRVLDLLDGCKRTLTVVHNSASLLPNTHIVEGVTEVAVKSPSELLQLLEKGVLLRNATGRTRGSKGHSTHAIFTLCIEQFTPSNGSSEPFLTVSQFTAVDLSGLAIEQYYLSLEDLPAESGMPAFHKTLEGLAAGDNRSKLTEATSKSSLTNLLHHCLDRRSKLVFFMPLQLDSQLGTKTTILMEMMSSLVSVQIAPVIRTAQPQLSKVWTYYQKLKEAQSQLAERLGEQEDRVVVLPDGSVEMDGRILNDLDAMSQELMKDIKSATEALSYGGQPLPNTSRMPHSLAGREWSSVLPKPQLPLGGLPSGPNMLLGGKLPMLPGQKLRPLAKPQFPPLGKPLLVAPQQLGQKPLSGLLGFPPRLPTKHQPGQSSDQSEASAEEGNDSEHLTLKPEMKEDSERHERAASSDYSSSSQSQLQSLSSKQQSTSISAKVDHRSNELGDSVPDVVGEPVPDSLLRVNSKDAAPITPGGGAVTPPPDPLDGDHSVDCSGQQFDVAHHTPVVARRACPDSPKTGGHVEEDQAEQVAPSYLSPVDPSTSLSAVLANAKLAPVLKQHSKSQQNHEEVCHDTETQPYCKTPLEQSSDVPSPQHQPLGEGTLLQHQPSGEGTLLRHQPSGEGTQQHQLEQSSSLGAQLGNSHPVAQLGNSPAVIVQVAPLQNQSTEIQSQCTSAPSVNLADDDRRESLVPALHQSEPPRLQELPVAKRKGSLPPVLPASLVHLPPRRQQLAPLSHATPSHPGPSHLYGADIELSDSLSSLGSDSDNDTFIQPSGVHTLGLPVSHRMSLVKPSLPPIPSEHHKGGAGVSTRGAVPGVEPPRYDQIAHQNYYQYTKSSQNPTQLSHNGHAHQSTTHQSGTEGGSGGREEVVRDYFREAQQFGSSVEIHTAAMEGVKSSIMKKLVFDYGVEHRDMGGRTPLMYAVLGNQPKMCEILLQMGANVNARDAAGLTPLLWAAYRARAQAMKVLLKHDADVRVSDPEGRTAFHWAMKTADTQCIKLLACKFKDGTQNKTDNEGLSPLHWAVMCDQDAHIHIFLSNAKVDATAQDSNGRTALNYAVLNFSPNSIKSILDHAEEVVNLRDGKGRTALHYACAEGATDCIRTLLAYKTCNIHCTDYQGTTPLHWAAASNQPITVQLLLRRGSDRNQIDKSGLTALGYAQQRGYVECISILETYGLKRLPSNISIASQFQVPPSQPNTVDEYGHVPLQRPRRFLASILDRGTADGVDRISRPASAVEPSTSSQGPPEAEGRPESVSHQPSDTSLPQSRRSSRASHPALPPERTSSVGQRVWRRLICGSDSVCGGRSNVVVPIQQ